MIKVFDPEAVAEPLSRRKTTDRSTPAAALTYLLRGRDVRCGILEQHCDGEEPILGIGPNLAGRFSGLLEPMEQAGLVRSSGAPDGRRRLWEIAR